MTDYEWLPKAIEWVEVWGCDRKLIEAAVEHPLQVTNDPKMAEVDYPVKRHRRGDLEVSVGFRDPDRPTILHIHIHLPLDRSSGSPTGSGSMTKSSTGGPKGLNQLKQMIHAAGYLPALRNGHLRVERQDGSYLMSMGSTPSDARSVTNCWKTFQKLANADATRQLLQDLADEQANI